MKRIATLSIFFTAFIDFALERARFDPWIVTALAIVILLWNLVGRTLRAGVDLQRPDQNTSGSGR